MTTLQLHHQLAHDPTCYRTLPVSDDDLRIEWVAQATCVMFPPVVARGMKV